jgi:hypothetical protein
MPDTAPRNPELFGFEGGPFARERFDMALNRAIDRVRNKEALEPEC